MAERARLRCPALNVRLTLPWWPEEITRTLQGWNVNTLERPQRRSLDVPTTKTTEERSLGFTLRNQDYQQSIAPMLVDLERISASRYPCQLILGDTDTGLWRMEPPQITETAWAADGSASVADVSLVLKRATEAIVRVGPVKKIRGSGRGFATRG